MRKVMSQGRFLEVCQSALVVLRNHSEVSAKKRLVVGEKTHRGRLHLCQEHRSRLRLHSLKIKKEMEIVRGGT